MRLRAEPSTVCMSAAAVAAVSHPAFAPASSGSSVVSPMAAVNVAAARSSLADRRCCAPTPRWYSALRTVVMTSSMLAPVLIVPTATHLPVRRPLHK